MFRFALCAAAAAIVIGGAVTTAPAQLVITSAPAGFTVSSLELGQPFAGALAFDPQDPTRLYASVGAFGATHVLRVDTTAGTTASVTGEFGNIGGLAVLSNGDLAITENFTSETIFRAHDLNSDGDFLDTGEVTELIAPILTDGNFTGAQLAVAPAGNAAALPAGALLVQTADGLTSSELLAIEAPDGSSPIYRPAGAAWFSGFQYNGGLAFTPQGNVIAGESQFDFFTFASTGYIRALVNSNADDDIDAGESNVLVGTAQLGAGLSDLTVTAEGQVFFTENGGLVRTFPLPADLLSGSSTPSVFAQTNGTYLSAVRVDRPARFIGGGAPAKLYVGGYGPGFAQASNLLVFQAAPPSVAEGWELFQ